MPDFRTDGNLPDPYTMYDQGYAANRRRQKLEIEDQMALGLAASQDQAGWPNRYPNVSFGVRAKAVARQANKGNATVV